MTDTDQPVNIAIIGGGFCGMLTAIHLLHHHEIPLHIHLINKGSVLGRGVAFDPHTPGLLLNVPNGKMSAFPDKPNHYLDWLSNQPGEKNKTQLATAFSARQQYGEYLNHTWEETISSLPVRKVVTVYNDYADDITELNRGLQVQLRGDKVLAVDLAVLATGNGHPRLPNGIQQSFTKSGYYFADPWKKDCIENLNDADDILIIGNGLTTVDTVIGLVENGCTRTIHTISPHGYRLHPWKEDKTPYTDFSFAGIDPEITSLFMLVKLLNKHRKIANSLNQSVYPLIDSLRPHIQQLWQIFSYREKQQFLRLLKPLWEKVRHRLPPAMFAKLRALQQSGQLVTHKGRIVSVREQKANVAVKLNCACNQQNLQVQRVINCTGPDPDIKRQGNTLLANLAKKGMIKPGPCGLGISAKVTGNIINTHKQTSQKLFTVGSSLKGVLWESTAVPELRLQAQNLAQHIISSIHVRVLTEV